MEWFADRLLGRVLCCFRESRNDRYGAFILAPRVTGSGPQAVGSGPNNATASPLLNPLSQLGGNLSMPP